MTAALDRLASDLIDAAGTRQAVRMSRALLTATAPAPDLIRRSAIASLPRTGGANEWVAESVTRVVSSGGLRSAGVTVRTRKSGHNLAAIDSGVLRHPNYNHRSSWSVTRVRPGFFTRPMREELTPAVTTALRAEQAATALRLTGGR